VTRLNQEQREAKVKRIEAIRKQVAKLETEKDVLTAELLADSKLNETEQAGSISYEFKSVINWRSFDTEAAARDFPIEDFPQLYEPTYKGTKKLIDQLGDEFEKDLQDYCDTSARLYIHHRSGPSVRRVTNLRARKR
jgi:predicted phage-related endonuclease